MDSWEQARVEGDNEGMRALGMEALSSKARLDTGARSSLVFFLPVKQRLLRRQHLKCPEKEKWAA